MDFISDESLDQLRSAIGNLRAHDGGAIPHRDILAFGSSLDGSLAVTLDLRASDSVGVPLLIVSTSPGKSDLLDILTVREREVAELIALGLTNKAIAHRLSLSPATVKDHVHHILRKTDLPNRASVVAHLSA